jgi:hypothetical protein
MLFNILVLILVGLSGISRATNSEILPADLSPGTDRTNPLGYGFFLLT